MGEGGEYAHRKRRQDRLKWGGGKRAPFSTPKKNFLDRHPRERGKLATPDGRGSTALKKKDGLHRFRRNSSFLDLIGEREKEKNFIPLS